MLDLSDSISLGSRENRATSEPEIMADSPSNMINTKSPESASKVMGKNSMVPNKALVEVSMFVCNSEKLVIRMEDHRVYCPDPHSRKRSEAHLLIFWPRQPGLQ